MPFLHLERIFEVGRYSRNLPTQRYVKDMAKTQFFTLATRTLKTFFRRVCRGAAGANVMQTDPMVASGMQKIGRGSVQIVPRCHQFGEMKNQIVTKSSNIFY